MSLLYVTAIFLLLSFLIGIIYIKCIKNQPLRWLILYLGIALIPDVYYFFVVDKIGRLVRIFYLITLPIEYLIYVSLLYPEFTNYKSGRSILKVSVVGIAFYTLYKLCFRIDEPNAAQDIFLVSGFTTLLLVLFYFYSILRGNRVIFLSEDPIFWVATGILFFYPGNLIATGFYGRIHKHSEQLAHGLYTLNYILNILRYILYALAFYIAAHKRNGR